MTRQRANNKTKNEGSMISFFLFFVLPTLAVVFISLILRTEIKFLYKDIYQKEKELDVFQSKLETRLVEIQKLSAEGRIVEIAKDRLGMIRINSPVENIYLSNLKINKIKRIVDSKYE